MRILTWTEEPVMAITMDDKRDLCGLAALLDAAKHDLSDVSVQVRSPHQTLALDMIDRLRSELCR